MRGYTDISKSMSYQVILNLTGLNFLDAVGN